MSKIGTNSSRGNGQRRWTTAMGNGNGQPNFFDKRQHKELYHCPISIKNLTKDNKKKIASLSCIHTPVLKLHAQVPMLIFPCSCPHVSNITCKILALTAMGNSDRQQPRATARGNDDGQQQW
jgi:hypothetical protein